VTIVLAAVAICLSLAAQIILVIGTIKLDYVVHHPCIILFWIRFSSAESDCLAHRTELIPLAQHS